MSAALLRQAVTARLDADPAVTAIAGDRVSWLVRGQGSKLPALVLQTVSGDRPQTLDGFEGIATARVQAAAMSRDQLEALALADGAIAVLVPEAEVEAGGATVTFWRGSAEEPRDFFDEDTKGGIHRVVVDLILRWSSRNDES
jgi:hypothetical protein